MSSLQDTPSTEHPDPAIKSHRDRQDFVRDLTALIPQLRAFARSLCRDPSYADDLAQEALASAWKARATYQPGTNLRAWVYLILRNKFYSDARRAWRSTPLNPEVAEATLVARDNLECIFELDEVRRGLALLTDQHREALILVGVGGLSYDEAADILKIPTGTVKSRVCRARTALAALLADGKTRKDGRPAADAFNAIVSQLKTQFGEPAQPAADSDDNEVRSSRSDLINAADDGRTASF